MVEVELWRDTLSSRSQRGATVATTEQPYVLVSTDGHCGADIDDYKPYLEEKYHDDFDAWRATVNDGWSFLDQFENSDNGVAGFGVSSFGAPVNWDSTLRQKYVEDQGIAAEVLFPNTIPPFYPSGAITAPGPVTDDEYRHRWAGVRAHNRWVADFCSELPGRRAGMAQIFLNNIEDAVAEIHRAAEMGLSGILLPGDHFKSVNQYFLPQYDPIWAACVEVDLPAHFHAIIVSDANSPEVGDASAAIGLFESPMFQQRPLGHLTLSGVFERFPELKVVFTEATCAWVLPYLTNLDYYYNEALKPGSLLHAFAYDAAKKLERAPSEYFATNCFLGSFFTQDDVANRHEIGLGKMMWGADFPHHEGTYPYTDHALRANFSSVSEDEVRAMTSENSAKVYDFDYQKLEEVAERIGPRPSRVSQPLGADEFPDDSVCPTLVSSYDVVID